MDTLAERAPTKQILPDDLPLERLRTADAGSLGSAELLSLLLADELTDPSNCTLALEQANLLLGKYQSLGVSSRRSLQELVRLPHLSLQQAARIVAAGEIGRRANRESFTKLVLDAPERVCQLMYPEYQGLDQESVRVVLLDRKRQLLRIEEIYRGTLSASVAHPREIFRPAILHSADAIILTHNHPLGDPKPSREDNDFTKQVVVAGATLSIEVADHVIIGSRQAGTPSFYSYKQEKKL